VIIEVEAVAASLKTLVWKKAFRETAAIDKSLTAIICRDLRTRNSFRSSKAKTAEKMEFTGVNEAFETVFNATGAENMNRAKVSRQITPFTRHSLFESLPAGMAVKEFHYNLHLFDFKTISGTAYTMVFKGITNT